MSRRTYRQLADDLARSTAWCPNEDCQNRGAASADEIKLACLIDCMLSLRTIARQLTCRNAQAIPRKLDAIRKAVGDLHRQVRNTGNENGSGGKLRKSRKAADSKPPTD